VYLCAFWSLGVQVRGLFGHAGILPVTEFLANASRWIAAQDAGSSKLLALPTIFWFASSDAALVGACVAGVAGSIALLAGIAPVPLLAFLWLLYLSLLNVGQTFLAFQWDALLVETGFLAIFLAPLTWRDGGEPSEPPRVARWLIWWLLFRLMLGSGIVKLSSGDPSWRKLMALALHYETQPLPTPLAWWAWLLPAWFHKLTTAATLIVELTIPWFIAAPGRYRAIACGSFVALQAVIALTGNYAFFNLLTVALSLTLLDNAQLARLVRPIRWRSGATLESAALQKRRNWPATATAIVAVITVPTSIVQLSAQAGVALPAATVIAAADSIVGPFRIVNPYGLFAVMTTIRPELTIEGTTDGVEWKPYVFKYKPAPDHASLAWVAPHQPRLDWQMWFAALGPYETDAWFVAFRARLIEGSADVIGLLDTNPFPLQPPVRVRVTRQVYRFATRDERHQSGSVWHPSDR
jgi:lipase maturation factor 1